MTILRVALDVPVAELFDYTDEAASEADIGCFAEVPFAKGVKVGVVAAVSHHSALDPARLRRPLAVRRDDVRVPAEVLALLHFCSEYYCHPLGTTILSAVPAWLARPRGSRLPEPSAYALTPLGSSISPSAFRRSAVRRAIWQALRDAGSVGHAALLEIAPTARRILREFVASDWIEPVPAQSHLAAEVFASSPVTQTGPALTGAQEAAVTRICASLGRFDVCLLHGVTGSGKTEVYLRVLGRALEQGGQGLLLVPEINLTPQLEARVTERFGPGQVVCLHSSLPEAERARRWLRAARGGAGIVVGTRLSVFTPLPALAVVIVDEEHDMSYKQQDGLRYHARDVAILRARNRGIPVVLGSATPSLETWHNAQTGRYGKADLPDRPSGETPALALVDISDKTLEEGLSVPVAEEIAAALARGEQALVFLNRRGFAPSLFCHACGWSAPCHRCTARLTIHLGARRLRCHYCGHEEQLVRACPDCGNQALLPVGTGTERLERALARRFPAARIVRVDRDTTRRKDAFAGMRKRIAERDVDILVGTQMLAKGHDFPGLSLVAVLGADNALYSSDYRAEERLYALLLQVAGRAGRARVPGRVLIQTAMPDHALYRALVSQDFAGFAATQLDLRRRMTFPPFAFHALLRAEATDEQTVFDFLESAARSARALGGPVVVNDPVAAPMARVAGRWRAHLLLQSTQRPALRALLAAWMPTVSSRAVRFAVDVDPAEF